MSRECPECQEEYDYYNQGPQGEDEPYVEEEKHKPEQKIVHSKKLSEIKGK